MGHGYCLFFRIRQNEQYFDIAKHGPNRTQLFEIISIRKHQNSYREMLFKSVSLNDCPLGGGEPEAVMGRLGL